MLVHALTHPTLPSPLKLACVSATRAKPHVLIQSSQPSINQPALASATELLLRALLHSPCLKQKLALVNAIKMDQFVLPPLEPLISTQTLAHAIVIRLRLHALFQDQS